MQTLVLGYGVSGKACMALLKKWGVPAVAVDKNPATGALPDRADFPLEDISEVILSPGIPPTHPIAARAERAGIPVVGELEFALRKTENRCIGITGSNGKTTTTLLIAHVLNSVGIKAKAVGNVGFALSTYLLEPDPAEILIVELSSFQLETLESKKFEAGVVLNLTPNHLDRYPSMEEYKAAKARIQECVEGKLLVSCQAWEELRGMTRGEVELFDAQHEESLAAIFQEEYIQLPKQNGLAAFAIAKYFGVGEEEFVRAVRTFQKPPHRVEWVAEIEGVRYFNDSKATSVEAVMHATNLLRGPIVLIAGGVDKGSPYQPWIEAFRGKVEKIVAYGAASAKMEQELKMYYPFERVETLTQATDAAKRSAKRGDAVLLSPGCSSYDQFPSYEHRGNEFKRLVRGIS